MYSWGAEYGQMFRIQMDHLPRWHWPATSPGEGYGEVGWLLLVVVVVVMVVVVVVLLLLLLLLLWVA